MPEVSEPDEDWELDEDWEDIPAAMPAGPSGPAQPGVMTAVVAAITATGTATSAAAPRAAVVAGAVCALVPPHLSGSALDLSGYTGAAIPVQLQPDLIALALPTAVFPLIAAAALVTETRALRRRGVTGMLRAN
jgi:hypothetical protein